MQDAVGCSAAASSPVQAPWHAPLGAGFSCAGQHWPRKTSHHAHLLDLTLLAFTAGKNCNKQQDKPSTWLCPAAPAPGSCHSPPPVSSVDLMPHIGPHQSSQQVCHTTCQLIQCEHDGHLPCSEAQPVCIQQHNHPANNNTGAAQGICCQAHATHTLPSLCISKGQVATT